MGTRRRVALGIEYDGRRFSGWQVQHHARSVQDVVQQALSRVADHAVAVHCAGRTDSGVHATGQVAHFDTEAERTPRAWVLGANANLPPDCAVQWACAVPAAFHARFSAVARHYCYLILRRGARSPLWHGRAVWTHRPLDPAPMRDAAAALVGRHDFTSFRALACQAKSPVRHVHYLRIVERGELLALEIGADGFLHHMVRNIAGVLMAIGRGEAAPDWTCALLALRDRTRGGVTAPPDGLYLTRVDYSPSYRLPAAGDSGATPSNGLWSNTGVCPSGAE